MYGLNQIHMGRNAKGEGALLHKTDIELRKRGEQKGLETPVVLAVDSSSSILLTVIDRISMCLECTVARLKPNEFGGISQQLWRVKLNSRIPDQSYHSHGNTLLPSANSVTIFA